MIDASRIVSRMFRSGFIVTALLAAVPATPLLATEENGPCFVSPTAACADTILQRALTLATSIPDKRRRDETLIIFASMQARLGDLAGARNSVDGISSPVAKASALRHVVSNIAASGDVDGTLALAERYGGGWLTDHALYNIAAQSAMSGDLDAARSTAFAIHLAETREKALNFIVGALIGTGDIKGAYTIAQKEKDASVRSTLLTSIATASVLAQDLDGALKILTEISDGAQRNELLFLIVNAQAQSGAVTEAIVSTERLANKTDRETALSDIASTQTFKGNFDSALAIVNLIGDTELRADIRSRVAIVRAERGNIEQALDEARQLSIPTHRDDALKQIASTLAFSQELARAHSVTLEIEDEDKRTETIVMVALAEQRAGNEEAALRMVRDVDQVIPRVRALIEIAGYQSRNYKSPHPLFSEVEHLLDTIQDPKTSDVVLAEYAAGLVNAKSYERAAMIAKRIKAQRLRGRAQANIAKTLAFYDQHDGALKILASVDDPDLRADTEEQLGMNAATTGKYAAALKYSKSIRDPSRRAVIMGFVAENIQNSPL